MPCVIHVGRQRVSCKLMTGREQILEACFVFFILFCAQDQRDAESLFVPSAPHVVSRLLDIMSGPHAATNLSASCPRFGSSQDKKAAERFYALTCGEDVKLWHLELYKPKEVSLYMPLGGLGRHFLIQQESR